MLMSILMLFIRSLSHRLSSHCLRTARSTRYSVSGILPALKALSRSATRCKRALLSYSLHFQHRPTASTEVIPSLKARSTIRTLTQYRSTAPAEAISCFESSSTIKALIWVTSSLSPGGDLLLNLSFDLLIQSALLGDSDLCLCLANVQLLQDRHCLSAGLIAHDLVVGRRQLACLVI